MRPRRTAAQRTTHKFCFSRFEKFEGNSSLGHWVFDMANLVFAQTYTYSVTYTYIYIYVL